MRSATGHSRNNQPQQICPLVTHQCTTVEESVSGFEDIRAYKLGKKRWSYNQCELTVLKEGSILADKDAQKLSVMQTALNSSSSHDSMENKVSYQVQLSNGFNIRVDVFLVIAVPAGSEHGQCERQSAAGTSYQWTPVTRSACVKGCTGPVLRSIQRFGRLGRRSNGPEPKATAGGPTSDAAGAKAIPQRKARQSNFSKDSKESRYMYLSMDEAGTHVGGHSFRLIVGAYDQFGDSLLGTGCSAPIRVLSNNDVPTGAAFIRISMTIRADWAGWAVPQNNSPDSVLNMMPALLSPALARLPLAEARQTTPDDQPILPPGADSPGFLPPQPPLNLDSQILGHQHILPEAADSSPFAFPTHFEGSALSPEVGSGHLPLLQEEDVQEQEDQFSSDDAPSYGQTSPQNSHQISGHLSSQIPDHMLRHMAGYMSRRASGCLSDESCGHLHSRPESADEELLGIIKHAQMSMAAAVEAAAAAAAAINSHAAANREHQLPSSCHSGLAGTPDRDWRQASAGQDHSEGHDTRRVARRHLLFDSDDGAPSRRSLSPLHSSMHDFDLPLKRARVSSAAELSAHRTAMSQPQSLQQLMTASNFCSQGAPPYALHALGLAAQGEQAMEAVQQRAAQWATQVAQAPDRGQHLPHDVGSLDALMANLHQEPPQSIKTELRRQQHGVMQTSSPQTSGQSVTDRDISLRGMMRSASANLEHRGNPRDPRQDPRGMKRVFTVTSMSPAPEKRLAPTPGHSADPWPGLHLPSPLGLGVWDSPNQVQPLQPSRSQGCNQDWPQQLPFTRFNINHGPPRSAGLLPRYSLPQPQYADATMYPSWHAT